MKKVGIIGGLGPASTLDYYNDIIMGYREKTHSEQYPELTIDSVNMTEVMEYMGRDDKEKLVEKLAQAVQNLAQAGADFAAIASNTPHIVFKELQEKSEISLISIIEATCNYAKKMNYHKVLVLGTKFTMSNGLYTNAFEKVGIEAIVPDEEGRDTVHHIIFPKLEDGIVVPEDKERMLQLIDRIAAEQGIEAVVLGCTELPLMIHAEDLQIPVLNTTAIHVEAIIEEII